MRLHLFDHGHRPHLLVVAGNATLARALAGSAPEDRFAVSVATGRAEALRLNAECAFNGFVIDSHLADASGDELVQALRAAHVKAPVLFIESLAGESAGRNGVEATITKPITLDEFRRRLQELFRPDDPTTDLAPPPRRRAPSLHFSTLLIPLLIALGIALTSWLLRLP